jgi:hypothetical protein
MADRRGVLMIFKNAYDDSPKYKGLVLRTWTHHYGGPEGFAMFATVWVAERNAFCDYCYEAGHNYFWGGIAHKDASDEVLRRWSALSEAARTPLPPAQRPDRYELLARIYGT